MKKSPKEKPKTRFMFIDVETIPRTLKQFEVSSKSWLGFPQALEMIGLKYEEVENRLNEGKKPFDDKVAMKRFVKKH